MDSRIHVLTLIDHLDVRGGAERLAVQVATRLDAARFRSTLCASRFDPRGGHDEATREALDELRGSGVGVLGLGRSGKVDVWVWGRLLRALRRGKVDVLHAHKFGSNVWGTAVGRLAGTPVVVAHEHTWSFEGRPVRRFLDRELIGRWADAFVAVSREDRRRMVEIERVPADVIRLVPNGAPPFPPPSGGDVRAELAIPDGVPVVGSVGFLREQKAYDVLIRAAAAMREALDDIRVVIVGEGDQRPALQRLIGELGLEGTVLLTGRRRDVPDVLRTLDVAVLSSDYEGSPLSVLEYMEAGLPVVATRVGGVPDLVEDGATGLLVEPRDPGALAAAVVRLLRNPDRAREMGEAGRARRRAEFGIDVTVRRLQELYEELLSARRATPSAAGPSPSRSQSTLL